MRKVQMRNTTQTKLREAMKKVLDLLAADDAINNLDAVLKTTDTQND